MAKNPIQPGRVLAFFKTKGTSKVQEQLAEYSFLRDFILQAARKSMTALVARSDYDAFGFDLILGLKGSPDLVKIQLKAFNGKAANWDVHKSFVENGGQVVLVHLKEVSGELRPEYRRLNEDKRQAVLTEPPKKKKGKKIHADRCMMKIGDTEVFTDLLLLFPDKGVQRAK